VIIVVIRRGVIVNQANLMIGSVQIAWPCLFIEACLESTPGLFLMFVPNDCLFHCGKSDFGVTKGTLVYKIRGILSPKPRIDAL